MLHPLRQSDSGTPDFAQFVADLFRRNGWKLQFNPLHDDGIGLHADKGKVKYLVAAKKSYEGRKDRLIPLLAQAILEVQAAAREGKYKSAAPLAVVVAPRIAESLVPEIRKFVDRYAPGVAIGVADEEGFQAFLGAGLESLNAPRAKPRLVASSPKPAYSLFSDLNQWMLKVLLAPRIPEGMISAPRQEYKNASQLAKAAGVSVMTAFRFLRQLEREGFLDDSPGFIKLVRVSELSRRWQAAALRPSHDIAMRFTIRGSESHFQSSLRSYGLQLRKSIPDPLHRATKGLPRCCLGLFAAAAALNVGFVHGVPPYVYIEELDSEVIARLGLKPAEGDQVPDVYVRVPWVPESIFRAAVERGRVPVCDILQVWLDVSSHPARGSAQADHIRSKLLSPLFEGSH